MNNKVTLNREKLKDVFVNAIYNKLKQRDGEITHTNRDYYYSPSRWWYDKYDASQGGYILQTSGNVETIKDASGQITVNVTLNFVKNPR